MKTSPETYRMNAFIKLTVVLCIVFTVCAIKIDDGEDELCSERTLVILDAKMSKFMPIGDSGRKLPETKEQAKKFCKYGTLCKVKKLLPYYPAKSGMPV